MNGPRQRIVLPAPEHPRVSVIIPAWRRPDLLRRCLASLARHRANCASFETVILLNGATPEVASVVSDETEGARVVHSRVNLGFGRGSNRAARKATGEFLVLLNDDTEVQEGWLDALVQAADAHPSAGAVGSRMVSYDGRLLEAGGLVWREAVGSHVGRGLPESTNHYRFLREVDYCSASSLLVRRTTWDAVGGFDERYFPGYYEDVDLCLSIRRLGQQILFQPRSCVRHFESGSLDWDSPYKDFIASRSQAQFFSKWWAELERFPAVPGTDDLWESSIVGERALLAARRLSRRILVVDCGGGPARDSSRLASAVVDLAGRRAAVSVFIDGRTDPSGYFADRGVEVLDGELVAHLSGPFSYDAVLFRRAAGFEAYSPAVRALQPLAAVLYDVEDATSEVLQLPEAARSAAGSPVIRADRVLCATAFDASLLTMVPGRAPLALVAPPSEPQAKPQGGSPWAPVTQSWADAVRAARWDVLRGRRGDRACGGRRP